MTALRTVAALAASLALLAAAPAAAQLSNRSIALDSGLSLPRGDAGPGVAVSLSATAWLEGPVEAVARVAWASAARTGGRGADPAVAATAGLRTALLPDPLRPLLGLEAGWARVDRPGGGAEHRLAAAAWLGVEWFAARDVAATARGGWRLVGGRPAAEWAAGLAAYF